MSVTQYKGYTESKDDLAFIEQLKNWTGEQKNTDIVDWHMIEDRSPIQVAEQMKEARGTHFKHINPKIMSKIIQNVMGKHMMPLDRTKLAQLTISRLRSDGSSKHS